MIDIEKRPLCAFKENFLAALKSAMKKAAERNELCVAPRMASRAQKTAIQSVSAQRTTVRMSSLGRKVSGANASRGAAAMGSA